MEIRAGQKFFQADGRREVRGSRLGGGLVHAEAVKEKRLDAGQTYTPADAEGWGRV